MYDRVKFIGRLAQFPHRVGDGCKNQEPITTQNARLIWDCWILMSNEQSKILLFGAVSSEDELPFVMGAEYMTVRRVAYSPFVHLFLVSEFICLLFQLRSECGPSLPPTATVRLPFVGDYKSNLCFVRSASPSSSSLRRD